MKTKLGSQRALALLCLVACSHVAQAADTPYLASGTASLSDISLKLVDLAPGSGQTPWITFGQQVYGGEPAGLSGWVFASGLISRDPAAPSLAPNTQDAYFEGPLPVQGVSVTSTDGLTHAAVTPTSYTASFQLRPEVLGQMTPYREDGTLGLETESQAVIGSRLYEPSTSINWSTGHVTVQPGSGSYQPVDFTLAPHTALVVEANASAGLTFNPELGEWDVRNLSESSSMDSPYLGAHAFITLARSTPTRPLADSYDSLSAYMADLQNVYGQTADGVSAAWQNADWAANGSMTPAPRHISLTLTNDSDESLDGVVHLYTETQVMMFKPAPSAVPEPASYLFMGMGLGLMAWRRGAKGRPQA